MNNNIVRKPLANILALRVSALLAAAFILLLAGVYLSLNREIRVKSEQYTKAIVGIFGDVIAYEADKNDRPLDLSYSDTFIYFENYICTWYKIDYLYAFVPDIDNETATFIALTKNRQESDEDQEDHFVGVTFDHKLSEEELCAWNDSTIFAVEKSERFSKGIDVEMCISDKSGNKVMVGADINTDRMRHDVLRGFYIIAAFVFVIIVALAVFIYLLIIRKVSKPLRNISKKLSEYISDGTRSKIKLESDNGDELSMMAASFNQMSEALDKYIDDLETLSREQERQQAEIDIASGIQKGILPLGNASLRHCDINAIMAPAKDIAGDLYDYFELDDTHTLTVVADVSGKGISSSILMALTLTHIRQYARMGYGPAEILKNLNETLSEENPKMMFVTAIVGIYDSNAGTFTYANAGHNPPYLIHSELEILDGSHGTPLGLFPGEVYNDVEVKVECGDTVFLYTDGVNEAVDQAGEFYGVERLEKVLKDTYSTADRHYVEAVEASLLAFADGAEQNDDITMLCFYAREDSDLQLGYDVSEFMKIRERLFNSGLPNKLLMDLCIVAEECFVNICSYAFDGPAPEGEKILFRFEYSNKVTMCFSDGGRRFDPRNNMPEINEYDIDNAVGGLGRYIAFYLADSVEYEYTDGRNILTITKLIKQ